MTALVPSCAPEGIRAMKAIAPLALLLTSLCCHAVDAPLPNIVRMMGDDHGWAPAPSLTAASNSSSPSPRMAMSIGNSSIWRQILRSSPTCPKNKPRSPNNSNPSFASGRSRYSTASAAPTTSSELDLNRRGRFRMFWYDAP